MNAATSAAKRQESRIPARSFNLIGQLNPISAFNRFVDN